MRNLYGVFVLCNIFWIVSLNRDNYFVHFERIEIEYNKSYGTIDFELFFINRTTKALNLTGYLLEDFPFSVNYFIEVKVYEFLSNEYKIFGLNQRYIFCYYMQSFYKHAFWKDMPDFLPPGCPIKKGTYKIRNYIPTQTSMPNLPFKKIKFEIIALQKETEIAKLTFYVQFDRDMWYREQYS